MNGHISSQVALNSQTKKISGSTVDTPRNPQQLRLTKNDN